MALHGEFTWYVIQLFTDVFANTLKLATAVALGIFWLVVNQSAWQFWWQRCAFGLFFSLRWSVYSSELRQFYFNSGKVTLNELIQ